MAGEELSHSGKELNRRVTSVSMANTIKNSIKARRVTFLVDERSRRG